MNRKDYTIAREFKKAIELHIPVIDFKIFGSRAKGTNDEYSDLDVFIVIDKVTKEKKDIIYEIAWEIGYKYDIYISPLILDEYEITSTAVKSAPIIENIKNQGITV
ncbi:MAG: nucleotidyltransferase domain-containing protein [Spirochaetota bacterium]|nr:nucleotidyltransferase domain-containing protein [Spirochaetota bacterium]